MKETVQSLRVYFIVIAVLSGIAGLVALFALPVRPYSLYAALAIVFGGAYFYVGIQLRSLLVTSPRIVLAVVLASGIAEILGLFVNLTVGIPTDPARLCLGLVITGYLYVNVRRLSSNERPSSSSTP